MNTNTMIVICHIVFILHFADAKGNVLFDTDESNDITDNDVDDCTHGQDVSKSEAVPLIDFDVLRVGLPNHDPCAFIKCSVRDTKNKLLTLTITNTEVTDKGDDPANYDDVAIMDGIASVSRDLLRKKVIFNSPGGQVERQHISSDKAYLHIQTNNCSTNAFSCLLIYTDQTGRMRIQVSTKRVKNVAKCVNAEVSASQRDFHDFRQKLKTLQSEVTELPGRLESEINDVSEKVEVNTQNTREWRDQVTQDFDDLKVNVAQNIDDFQQTEKVLKIQVTSFDDKVKLLEVQLSDSLKYVRKARRLNKVFKEVKGLKRKVTELQKVVDDSKNGNCSAPNKICEKGEKGDQGQPGLGMPGMKGEKGERGLGGSGGTHSSKGEKGEPGIMGESGLPGLPGKDGAVGKPGSKGVSGDPGPLGPKGNRGFDGLPGLPGLKGEQGLPGNPGEKGEKGENGLVGRDGLPGLDGLPGPKGEKGEIGESGSTSFGGRPGLTGRKGQKGERGETGPVGPMGPPVVLSETHTPNFDTEGPSRETCLDGWVYHDGSCYGFGTEAMSWANAQDVCNAFNAALVTIDSEEENSFLKTLPSTHSENVFTIWIGATDIFTEGRWQWVSTQETIGPFTDWAPGEPNSDPTNGGEHCMSFIRDANWQWNDENCFGKGYFICEKQLKDQVKSLKVRRN